MRYVAACPPAPSLTERETSAAFSWDKSNGMTHCRLSRYFDSMLRPEPPALDRKLRLGLSNPQAYRYLARYKGIDFLEELKYKQGVTFQYFGYPQNLVEK